MTTTNTPTKARKTKKKPAVEVAREQAAQKRNENKVYTDSNEVQYRLVPVSAIAVQAAMSKVPDPKIRTFKNPTTGTEDANPQHPDYIRELGEVENERALASADTFVMFGFEIIDGLNCDERGEKWLDQLAYLGLINDDEAEKAKDDPFVYEFYYKKYKLSDATTITKIQSLSGVTQEQIAAAKDSFPSDQTWISD